MSISPTLSQTATINLDGVPYQSSVSVTSNSEQKTSPTALIPAATPGTYSGTNTLTVPSNPFTTGQIIALFWVLNGISYSQHDVTVGTVSGNSVPISGGTGDTLPAVGTAITACVGTSEPMVVTGNNVVGAVGTWLPQPGDGNAYVSWYTSAPALIATVKLTTANPTGAYINGAGMAASPFAGVSVATCQFFHGQTSTRQMLGAILNN